MRCESHHRLIKASFTSTSCKKNVIETIAIKQSLYMYSLYANYKYEKVELGKTDPESSFLNYAIVDQANEKNFYKEIKINGINYKLGMFIVTDLKEPEVEFGEILKIVKVKKDFFFI